VRRRHRRRSLASWGWLGRGRLREAWGRCNQGHKGPKCMWMDYSHSRRPWRSGRETAWVGWVVLATGNGFVKTTAIDTIALDVVQGLWPVWDAGRWQNRKCFLISGRLGCPAVTIVPMLSPIDAIDIVAGVDRRRRRCGGRQSEEMVHCKLPQRGLWDACKVSKEKCKVSRGD